MKAFIIVDIQYDFCPGGALPVKEGDKVIPIINSLQDKFDVVVATQDWHPKDHGSFASVQGKHVYDQIMLFGLEQTLWPDHCVQGTHGAELHKELKKERIGKIFYKATDKNIDSYSAFFDNGHKKSTGLAPYLKAKGVNEIYIAGLAADYCVKFTALDAIALGYKTAVIRDACRGVNIAEDDSKKAFDEMEKAGVILIDSDSIK